MTLDARALPAWPLALAAGMGLALAAYGVARPSERHAAVPDAVAVVNGVPISRADYDRALTAAAAARRHAKLERDERQRVLDRLVEEELLLQRALELGLVRSDVRIRSALTHAVVEAAASMDDAVPSPASEADIRRFFDENRADFAEPARLTIEQIFYRADGQSAAERRAAEAYARLSRGESFEAVKATGDPEARPLPLGPVAPAKLADYVGANGVREAISLGPGAVSKPFSSAWGAHLVRVRSREPARIPALEEVRDAVAAEYRRRTGERTLRRYVEDLRRQATIDLAEDAP